MFLNSKVDVASNSFGSLANILCILNAPDQQKVAHCHTSLFLLLVQLELFRFILIIFNTSGVTGSLPILPSILFLIWFLFCVPVMIIFTISGCNQALNMTHCMCAMRIPLRYLSREALEIFLSWRRYPTYVRVEETVKGKTNLFPVAFSTLLIWLTATLYVLCVLVASLWLAASTSVVTKFLGIA